MAAKDVVEREGHLIVARAFSEVATDVEAVFGLRGQEAGELLFCDLTLVGEGRLILAHPGKPESLIHHVADRSGHDRRYALDSTKARTALGWQPQREFAGALAGTIDWYAQCSFGIARNGRKGMVGADNA